MATIWARRGSQRLHPMRTRACWVQLHARVRTQAQKSGASRLCPDRSWGPLGGFGGPLGATLESSWALLGLSWALLGLSWGPLGVLLGLSWGLLGSLGGLLGAILEAIDQKRAWILFPPPRRGLQVGLLWPSWGPLGALLGVLGPLLGSSWAPLGALGHIGATLRPQKPIRSEKGRGPTTLMFLRFLKGFGFSGASLGGALAS